MESMSSRTSRPWSRKPSAIRVATNAALQADQRRLVGGGDDDDGAREALGAEVLLEELLDLAATLADQRDHPDVGLGAAGDLRQQRRLAHAGAGEDAQALALADRDEGVQRADADGQRLVDPAPRQRVRGLAGEVHPLHAAAEGGAAVDRAAQAVEHPAQQRRPDRDLQRHAGGAHRGAGLHAPQLAQRHAGQPVAADGDHLGEQPLGAGVDLDEVADGGSDALDAQGQAHRADDGTGQQGTRGHAGAVAARW